MADKLTEPGHKLMVESKGAYKAFESYLSILGGGQWRCVMNQGRGQLGEGELIQH